MTKLKAKIYRKEGKQRRGKGFSREELKKVDLSLREALKLGIPIDSRRRTFHKENVNVIKKFVKSKTSPSKRSKTSPSKRSKTSPSKRSKRTRSKS